MGESTRPGLPVIATGREGSGSIGAFVLFVSSLVHFTPCKLRRSDSLCTGAVKSNWNTVSYINRNFVLRKRPGSIGVRLKEPSPIEKAAMAVINPAKQIFGIVHKCFFQFLTMAPVQVNDGEQPWAHKK